MLARKVNYYREFFTFHRRIFFIFFTWLFLQKNCYSMYYCNVHTYNRTETTHVCMYVCSSYIHTIPFYIQIHHQLLLFVLKKQQAMYCIVSVHRCKSLSAWSVVVIRGCARCCFQLSQLVFFFLFFLVVTYCIIQAVLCTLPRLSSYEPLPGGNLNEQQWSSLKFW